MGQVMLGILGVGDELRAGGVDEVGEDLVHLIVAETVHGARRIRRSKRDHGTANVVVIVVVIVVVVGDPWEESLVWSVHYWPRRSRSSASEHDARSGRWVIIIITHRTKSGLVSSIPIIVGGQCPVAHANRSRAGGARFGPPGTEPVQVWRLRSRPKELAPYPPARRRPLAS